MVSHMQVSKGQGKENSFIEGKEVERVVVSITFHWLNPCKERKVFLLAVGLC